MATKKKYTPRKIDPLPNATQTSILTGWCSGLEENRNHAGCPAKLEHTMNNSTNICPCKCHKD